MVQQETGHFATLRPRKGLVAQSLNVAQQIDELTVEILQASATSLCRGEQLSPVGKDQTDSAAAELIVSSAEGQLQHSGLP
jgi:hypothetical protein